MGQINDDMIKLSSWKEESVSVFNYNFFLNLTLDGFSLNILVNKCNKQKVTIYAITVY